MLNHIALHYNYQNRRTGPGKVAINLAAGLKKLKVKVDYNVQDATIPNGCLQKGARLFRQLPSSTLMGPNLVVNPTDDHMLWQQYENFVVPSQWVLDFYVTSALTNNAKFWVWSAGIDTKFWTLSDSLIQDCFVYYKPGDQRTLIELEALRGTLRSMGMKFTTITYGEYDEQALLNACHHSKFAILLTGTESQGIAYMEILATGTPCLVSDCIKWNKYSATSVPYFDSRCGAFLCNTENVENPWIDAIQYFNRNYKQYDSRMFIEESHTLEISAQRYLDILGDIHGS